MNKSQLKKYAKAVVTVGANVKKGQYVIINIAAEKYEFARELVECCYKRGACKVIVQFSDEVCGKHGLIHQSLEELSDVPVWRIEKQKWIAANKPVMIYVESEDPAGFDGVDIDKMMKSNNAQRKILRPITDAIENQYQWVICALPSVAWAKRVFPYDSEKVAYKKLEKAILDTTRVSGKNPVNDWKEHVSELKSRAAWLNSYHFDHLIYTSSNGTNLTLKLNPYHVWISAESETLSKRTYVANMPTEECFTMPDREGVDGVVCSALPLSYNGALIEDFKIYFEKGRVVKVEAKKNQDLLQQIVDTDEGSHRLGEVALVPYSSPIRQTGILFLNTLFDENASCHLALGRGFEDNIIGYEQFSNEELEKMGLNKSLQHVDFMVGTKDLDIVGVTKDGKKVQVFKSGTWAE